MGKLEELCRELHRNDLNLLGQIKDEISDAERKEIQDTISYLINDKKTSQSGKLLFDDKKSTESKSIDSKRLNDCLEIGNLLYLEGNIKEAKEYYKYALEIAKNLNESGCYLDIFRKIIELNQQQIDLDILKWHHFK